MIFCWMLLKCASLFKVSLLETLVLAPALCRIVQTPH